MDYAGQTLLETGCRTVGAAMSLVNPADIIAGSEMLPAGGSGVWWAAGLSGMAIMVSAVVLAFIYVWGVLFRNPQAETYVKQELFELFVSAVMVVLIFGAVGAVSTLRVGDILGSGMIPEGVDSGDSVYVTTAKYFERVDRDMQGWLELNYWLNMYVDQMASVTPYARPLGVGLVASPMAGFATPIKQLLYNMTVAVSVAFMINWAQLVVYVFALQGFLKYYLPFGIFLRCFTPTRRLGGTLIGMTIAFLLIFPALILLAYSVFYSQGGPMLSVTSMIEYYINDTNFKQSFSDFFTNNFTGGFVDLIGTAFGGIGTLLQALVGKFFLMMVILPISIVSWAFIIGFVVPAFNIIMFTQAARGLSKSFGEEVDISSLTRMI